jgi:hypothetical protein
VPKCIAQEPRTIERWLRENLCPKSGSEDREVHRLMLKAANACRNRHLTADQAFEFIDCHKTRNEKTQGEISEAVQKAYSTTVSGKSAGKPKWPDVNLELVENIVSDANGFTVEDLKRSSAFPDRQSHCAEVVETLLGCDDRTLICIGWAKDRFVTDDFANLKDQLPNAQFIVPSPMSARTWLKANGDSSAKGNANTGRRRNLVVEFDIKPVTDKGEPTIWFPLVEKWEAASIAVKDAMAALIEHLRKQGPLMCVVDSGGKSLHAWFHCAGESEESGSSLHKFFEYAVSLGADRATWTVSQFVRMPGGKRDNGNRQTVLYYDPNAVAKRWEVVNESSTKENLNENDMNTTQKNAEREGNRDSQGEGDNRERVNGSGPQVGIPWETGETMPDGTPIRILRIRISANVGCIGKAQGTRKIPSSHSILDLSKKEINEEDTLLGDRYLCRGGGMIAVGPSGQGKSSMSFQMAALFASGKPAFGITPARPLRVLVIQAEDDEGDCIEMSWVIDYLGLGESEKQRVQTNTLIVPVNHEVGSSFLKLVDAYLGVWPTDILIINPYTAYLGSDSKNDEANTLFLRTD